MKKKTILTGMLTLAIAGTTLLSGCGINEDATLVDINNGEDSISLGYGNFVARYTQSMYDMTYLSYMGTDMWTQEEDGTTLEDNVKESVMEAMEEDYLLQKHADDYDIALTDEEKASIDELLAERASKQQEVQDLAASTSDNISSYVSQISASQEEAAELTAEINNADNSIAQLVQQAEEEKAAREAAQAKAEAEAEAQAAQEQESTDSSESESYDETDSYEESSDTDSSDDTYSEDTSYDEEADSEDSYSEDSDTSYDESEDTSDYEDTADSSASDDSQSSSDSSSSGQGKYLGNFTLTAYCNCAQCCGTAGNATASGAMPTAGHTVAMAGVPFGTQLLINGNVYTVEDLGTPYGHVDIYFNSHSEALSFGLQYADVYQLN